MRWEQLYQEKERLEALFPLENELPFVLVRLEEAIRRFPLDLRSIRPGAKNYHHSYGTTRIDLSLSGRPDNIEVFLNRVTNFSPFLTLDTITWTAQEDGDIVDLEMELYFVVPEHIEPLLEQSANQRLDSIQ